MPDSYAHKKNAQNALIIAEYTPKNYQTFIWGCNGADPLFSHRMYNPFRKISLSPLGHRMHKEKTGLFLQNLFRYAQTDAQKDYCLGFLCHYALDSVMHPYINYVTTAYANSFNIKNGHGYFESSLDSKISYQETGKKAADPLQYCPDIKKNQLDQIVTLFKHAVEATYDDVEYDRLEYMQAFKDFKLVKNLLYSPKGAKVIVAKTAEKLLHLENGFVVCHMQPGKMEIKDVPVWRNDGIEFFSLSTIEELLKRADYMSADYINVGLEYFKGVYSSRDFLEDIGNKSYETGLVIDL